MVIVNFVSIVCRKKYTTLARTFSYYKSPRIIRINAKQDWSHWETVTCIFFLSLESNDKLTPLLRLAGIPTLSL